MAYNFDLHLNTERPIADIYEGIMSRFASSQESLFKSYIFMIELETTKGIYEIKSDIPLVGFFRRHVSDGDYEIFRYRLLNAPWRDGVGVILDSLPKSLENEPEGLIEQFQNQIANTHLDKITSTIEFLIECKKNLNPGLIKSRSVRKSLVEFIQDTGKALDNLQATPNAAGVYFIGTNKDLIYIGFSDDVGKELNSHDQLWIFREMKNVKVSYRFIDDYQTNEIESIAQHMRDFLQPTF